MEILYHALVFLHLLGMAGILSGWLMQVMTSGAKSPKVILHSAFLQLITGLAMVAFLETGLADPGPDGVAHIKIAVKTTVVVAVLVVGILNVRKPSSRLATLAGVLAILNVGVAVFW
jgi:hypothetical protein